MAYFRRFVDMSSCLRWERKGSGAGAGADGGRLTLSPPLAINTSDPERADATATTATTATTASPYLPITQLDIASARVRLAFKDADTHFVFGGDAFDHGPDLSFGAALLDFKARHPGRVHFILGNRDINKMVMVPLMQEVCEQSPQEAEWLVFPHHRPGDGLRPAELHYGEFLEAAGLPTDRADRVSFLWWALRSKMGSPNAFENRRMELQVLQDQRIKEGGGGGLETDGGGGGGGTPAAVSGGDEGSHPVAVITDENVAESFFVAARPGGVYYELIKCGVMMLALEGILFVHGGVNADNVGFVPDLAVGDITAQAKQGRRLISVDGGADPSDSASVGGSEKPADALSWIAAVNAFKDESFREWADCTGLRGEVIRHYVFPRNLVPYSVTVGSFVDLDGPHCVTLPVVQYLLESGLDTVCGGHQPAGDSPAIVRQPGNFIMIDADNSYSGRQNAFCGAGNGRGRAVQEVVFYVNERASGDQRQDEEEEVVVTRVNGGHEVRETPAPAPRYGIVMRGQQAAGRPFHFHLGDHPLIGRCVGDDWWVKLPLFHRHGAGRTGTNDDDDDVIDVNILSAVQTAVAEEAPFYELHRTRDGYRTEEVRVLSCAAVADLLRGYHANDHVPLPGQLRQQYTREQLAEVRVHRIKTKRSPTSGGKEEEEEEPERSECIEKNKSMTAAAQLAAVE